VVVLSCLAWAGCARSPRPELAPVAAPTAQPREPVRVLPQREWRDAILYFVMLDRFADGDSANDVQVDRTAKGAFHGGDVTGLREQLDELADLGVTAIWITPVVKNIDGFVTGAGFPDWAYHGYWADDFRRLDRRFGTEEELRGLVEDCHERGIKLLLDVVYNHAGYGSHYLTDPSTRGWLRDPGRNECGNDDITSCVAGLPDFRTELPQVADYLMDAHIGRAERVGLDGFRLDTVKHVAHEFWQEHRRRTRESLGEGFFLLGEVWGGDAKVLDPWFEPDEMDAGFDFSFKGNVAAFVQGRGRTVAFNRYLERRHEVREGYLLAHFLSSHDVPMLLWELGGDVALFRLAVALQFTVAGLPTIYYGEEVGRIGGEWPENRSDMPWGDRKILPGSGKPRDEDLRAFYRRLIAIRRDHPALWKGTYRGLLFEDDVLVYLRRDEAADDAVLVALNRGASGSKIEVPLPEGLAASVADDLLNGGTVPVAAGKLEASLPGRSVALLHLH